MTAPRPLRRKPDFLLGTITLLILLLPPTLALQVNAANTGGQQTRIEILQSQMLKVALRDGLAAPASSVTVTRHLGGGSQRRL